MAKSDLINAFSTTEEIHEKFKHFFRTDKTIAYYENYKRGVLDRMAKHPELVPEKWKKLVARLNK